MDWQTFGVVAAVGYLVVLLTGLTRFTGSRNLKNLVNPVNPVPKNAWMVFLVFAVIATVEAQKPTNNVPQNLSAPLAQMQGGGSLQTGLTGLTGFLKILDPINPATSTSEQPTAATTPNVCQSIIVTPHPSARAIRAADASNRTVSNRLIVSTFRSISN